LDDVLVYGCREIGALAVAKTLPFAGVSEQAIARVAEFEKTSKFCAMDGRTSEKLRVKASLNKTGAESPWH
jgi:hypothetical protein